MTYQYVKPTEAQKEHMQHFRDKFETLSEEITRNVLDSRGKTIAKQKLEEASFWINKAITKND